MAAFEMFDMSTITLSAMPTYAMTISQCPLCGGLKLPGTIATVMSLYLNPSFCPVCSITRRYNASNLPVISQP